MSVVRILWTNLCFLMIAGFVPSLWGQQTTDLVVEAWRPGMAGQFTAWPNSVVPGGTINISSWRVRNSGTINVSSFSNGIFLSTDKILKAGEDIRIGGTNVDALTVGTFKFFLGMQLVIPQAVGFGSYYIGILIDESNSIAETNEINNQLMAISQIKIIPPVNADLVSYRGINIVIGEDIYSESTIALAAPDAKFYIFSWGVQNLGVEDAPAFIVGFYLSNDAQISRADRLLGSRQIPGIRAGLAYDPIPYEFSADLTDVAPGDYYIGIFIDNLEQVTEVYGGKEGNNTRSARLKVLDIPSDKTQVWRIQARLTTADVRYAGTNDYVYISLNKNHKNWIDYARNDFKRGESFTYDINLGDIEKFGDIQFLKLGKEGSDALCLTDIQLILNNVEVFNYSYLPSRRWIETGTINFKYSDLRTGQEWKEYFPDFPNIIRRTEIESIVEAAVGNSLKSSDGYWGDSGDVKATYLSPNSLHINVDFKGYVPNFWDVDVDLDFNISITCDCGTIELSINDFDVDVDGNWLYDVFGIVDGIQKELKREFKGVSENFSRGMNLGISICPNIEVKNPSGNIELEIPPLKQNLVIQTSLDKVLLKPGESTEITTIVHNAGNITSDEYFTDIYFVKKDRYSNLSIEELINSGVRLNRRSNNGLDACTTPSTWNDTITMPSTLECSYSESAGNPIIIPGFRGNLSTFPRRRFGYDYLIISVIQSQSEDESQDNYSVNKIEIGLPDLEANRFYLTGLPNLSYKGNIVVGPGSIKNIGKFRSNSLQYTLFLLKTQANDVITLIKKTGPSLSPGGEFVWGRMEAKLPDEATPGTYYLGVVVEQSDNSAECNLDNNTYRITVVIQ